MHHPQGTKDPETDAQLVKGAWEWMLPCREPLGLAGLTLSSVPLFPWLLSSCYNADTV